MSTNKIEYIGQTDAEESRHLFERRDRIDEFSEEVQSVELSTDQLVQAGINLLTKETLTYQEWERLMEVASVSNEDVITNETDALSTGEFELTVHRDEEATVESSYGTSNKHNFPIGVTGTDKVDEEVTLRVEAPNDFINCVSISGGYMKTEEQFSRDDGTVVTESVFKLALPMESGSRIIPSIEVTISSEPLCGDQTFPQTVVFSLEVDGKSQHTEEITYMDKLRH
jgi:hypothetical protein